MSEDGDIRKEMREESKIHRTDKQNWSRELLEEWCLENKIDMRAIADWQFRLTNVDSSKKIDIYPQRQKYHNLKNNTRGKFKNLIAFVSQHFNINTQ